MALQLATHPGGGGDATFVTRNIPDISPNAGLVALCTVPSDRAGPDDLGWHIADFLAFKTILGGYLHEKAQTWLAHCDIAQLISDNPEAYAHGTDRRIFSPGKLTNNIRVESSADILSTEFSVAITKTANIVKKHKFDLVIIICGPTTLEQDAFFGNTDYKPCIRSTDIRTAMGSDDCNAMVITPSLFSAGWQVNPSFCRLAPFHPRADRVHFLAKQFGAIFARSIVEKVTGWKCPMLDLARFDRTRKDDGSFTGPLNTCPEKAILAITLQQALAARLMQEHSDHSFSFDVNNDDWVKLIRTRKHRTLAQHQHEWVKLPTAQTPVAIDARRLFPANLFGGVRASQVAHIKHLVQDSLTAWQGVWVNEYGSTAKAKFQEFLDEPNPDNSDCQEMSYVMEQRSTLLVVADLLVDYFNLPVPLDKRCRDYDGIILQPETVDQAFRDLCQSIPWVNLHPDRSIYKFGLIQTPHQRNAYYVATALSKVYTDSTSLNAALDRIRNLFEVIQYRQLQLLFEDPGIRLKCRLWLTAIKMPVLSVPRFSNAPRLMQETTNTLPTTAMSTLSISDSTATQGKAKNHEHIESKTAGGTEAQERLFPPQGGGDQNKQPGDVIIQDIFRNALKEVGNKNAGGTQTQKGSSPTQDSVALEERSGNAIVQKKVGNSLKDVENKTAVATQEQKKPSPTQDSVALEERSGNAIVQNKVEASLKDTAVTSNGGATPKGNGLHNGNSNDTTTKLDIRQKAVEYVTGIIDEMSSKDIRIAAEACPELGEALVARMLRGEICDLSNLAPQTPVRQNTTSAGSSTQVHDSPQASTKDLEQTTDKQQVTVQNELFVWPHLRGRQDASSAVPSTQVGGESQASTMGLEQPSTSTIPSAPKRDNSQTATKVPEQEKNEGQAAAQKEAWVWPHLRGRENTNAALPSAKVPGYSKTTTNGPEKGTDEGHVAISNKQQSSHGNQQLSREPHSQPPQGRRQDTLDLTFVPRPPLGPEREEALRNGTYSTPYRKPHQTDYDVAREPQPYFPPGWKGWDAYLRDSDKKY